MRNSDRDESRHQVFVDAHVHIHDCFDLSAFFDAALNNFKQISSNPGMAGNTETFVLLLSESLGKNYFRKLRAFADNGLSVPGQTELPWQIKRTDDSGALQACRQGGDCLYILAGRQIITSEKLEILALMTEELFDDGQVFTATIESVGQAGAICVLPWGVGKWTGKRGRILKRYVMESNLPVFLGDNSGRPTFWPRPKLFETAETGGGRILPGTDPLPLPREIRKTGGYGFILNAGISSRMSTDLKNLIKDPDIVSLPYGMPENMTRFIKNQFAIRISNYS